MGNDGPLPSALIEWGVAERPLPGETVSGDRHLVQPLANGVLVAAVDGLGHGDDASLAGTVAVATLAAHAREPILSLVQRCHEALQKGTRGVVLSLALFSTGEPTLTWLGVGNVEGVLFRADPLAVPARDYVPQRGGVVGYQMPPLAAEALPVCRGDLLILATDGIRSSFPDGVQTDGAPQEIADQIMARYGKDTDDALVLVARYLGGTP